MSNKKLSDLKNIGKTIEKRLHEIGVETEADLAAIGPIAAYQKIKQNYPNKTIPVCYYLYSLQGALMDIHWDDLPNTLKHSLLDQL